MVTVTAGAVRAAQGQHGGFLIADCVERRRRKSGGAAFAPPLARLSLIVDNSFARRNVDGHLEKTNDAALVIFINVSSWDTTRRPLA